MLLGLLSLGVAAYLMLQYLDQLRLPSFHNSRMYFSEDGSDGHSITEALSQMFSKYGWRNSDQKYVNSCSLVMGHVTLFMVGRFATSMNKKRLTCNLVRTIFFFLHMNKKNIFFYNPFEVQLCQTLCINHSVPLFFRKLNQVGWRKDVITKYMVNIFIIVGLQDPSTHSATWLTDGLMTN